MVKLVRYLVIKFKKVEGKMDKKKAQISLIAEAGIFLIIAIALFFIKRELLQKYKEICFWVGGGIIVMTILLNFISHRESQRPQGYYYRTLPTATNEKAYQRANRVIADELALADYFMVALIAGSIPILVGVLIENYLL